MLSSFGKSVATGDFDGNGFSDFAIGAPLWSKISKDGFVIPNIGKVQIVYVSNFDTDVGNFEISRKFGSKSFTQNIRPYNIDHIKINFITIEI